jgi:hypothetical protein
MLFKWFDASTATQFGSTLAQGVIAKIPLDISADDKKFSSKAGELLKGMDRQIASFKQTHPLNLYKKAKLGNAFKWALLDAGYRPAYVDELTEWLLARC